ncbi:MAG: penicillin-binding protein 1A [Patiriisocius sp.]|jgi:penicillin-binding protein 1A
MAKKSKKAVKAPASNWKYIKWFWLLAFSPILLIALMLTMAAFSDLPSTAVLENPKSNLATEIFTVDSKLLGKYYRENRTNVNFEDISPNVIDALISTEDERYMEHSGVDMEALARVVKGVLTGSTNQGGGSTITQQLAKLLFSEKPKSKLARVFQKFQEWIISVKLEKSYTKEEILTMYLNQYDFLHQAVGIKSAANIYFSKEPSELNIQESAMLVGMLKNSSYYNPRRESAVERVTKRREVVMKQMLKHEFLDREMYDSLRMLPLGLRYQKQAHDEGSAPYFREILRAEVKSLLKATDKNGNLLAVNPNSNLAYDMYEDGLKVYTTIDSRLQGYAEFAVTAHLKNQLQDQFDRSSKNLKNRPFSDDLTTKETEKIMTSAIQRSKSHKVMVGKLCSNCERNKYMEKTTKDDGEYYHCSHCKHDRKANTKADIKKYFDTPKRMSIFSWDGNVDTLLTPIDSIRYYKGLLQAGMMSMEPSTGAVKAWVGGIDFKHFKYDHVKQAKRQVGSTFKPIVYATAIIGGYKPCHPVPKIKTTIEAGTYNLQEDWTPEDSDGNYGFMADLKWGLANSVNTITTWVMKEFGPAPVVQLAKDMGIKSELIPVPSLCLGVADLSVFEITAANSTFANKGVYIEPYIISRIEDKNGNVIYQSLPETNEAIDEKTAYIMLEMMKGTVEGAYNEHLDRAQGTAMRLRSDLDSRDYDGIPKTLEIACKTGTTQNQSDGWFIGLIPDLATGIWVGADDRSVHFNSLQYGMGTNMALPIWGYYTKKILEDKSINLQMEFDRPLGLDIEEIFDCNEKDDQDDFDNEFEDV